MPECEHEYVYRMPDAERCLKCGVIIHVVRVLHEVRTELEAAKAQIAELTKERDAARSAVRIAADARESLNAALEDLQSAHGLRCQLATAVEALESIASCTSYIDGDLVSIAREAIAAIRAPEKP